MSKFDDVSAPPPYEGGKTQEVPLADYPSHSPAGYPQQQVFYPTQPGYYPPQSGFPQQQGIPQAGPQQPPYQYTNMQVHQPYNGPPPQDHCTFSILNTIFCCFWIGIFAIIKSQSVRDSVARGDFNTAARLSKEVLTLNKVALGVGIVLNLIYIAAIVFYIVIALQLLSF